MAAKCHIHVIVFHPKEIPRISFPFRWNLLWWKKLQLRTPPSWTRDQSARQSVWPQPQHPKRKGSEAPNTGLLMFGKCQNITWTLESNPCQVSVFIVPCRIRNAFLRSFNKIIVKCPALHLSTAPDSLILNVHQGWPQRSHQSWPIPEKASTQWPF